MQKGQLLTLLQMSTMNSEKIWLTKFLSFIEQIELTVRHCTVS